MMAEKGKGRGRARGRGGSHDMISTAGAGGDSQISTLNAEAPEFQPTASLMEHIHMHSNAEQMRYAHHSNFTPNMQAMSQPRQYSAVVSSNAPQSGDARDLVQNTVVRIREKEKLHEASDTLLSYLRNSNGVEEMKTAATRLMTMGEHLAADERTNADCVFQLVLYLSDKLRNASRSFSTFMLQALNERLKVWHTCVKNSGYVPQCAPFLSMLSELYPTLASISHGQPATVLGLSILSLLQLLLRSDEPRAHQQLLEILYQIGAALQDELISDKDGQTAEANNGGANNSVANGLEGFYQEIRVHIANSRFANPETAVHFIALLEFRAGNWGRIYQRPISAEGGLSRQNSEAMMDDDMYECYERFLAETGQI